MGNNANCFPGSLQIFKLKMNFRNLFYRREGDAVFKSKQQWSWFFKGKQNLCLKYIYFFHGHSDSWLTLQLKHLIHIVHKNMQYTFEYNCDLGEKKCNNSTQMWLLKNLINNKRVISLIIYPHCYHINARIIS